MDKKKLAKISPTSNNNNYATVIYDLHIKLKKAKNDKEKVKIYSEFSQNYLMSKPLWNKRFCLQPVSEIYKEAVYHFYYSIYNDNIKNFYPKMLDGLHPFLFGHDKTLYRKNDPFIIKSWQKLLYPHRQIQQHLMWHEEYSSSPLPKEIFGHVNKMEKLYWKIKASENNDQKWLEYIKEANDPEFVKQNVQERLGQNLNNKKLWKLYISYLRENDPKEMLQVYSKYCRFFLDDFEMKNEYKNATEKYGPIFVPWKNPFTFENMLSRNTQFSQKMSKVKEETKQIPLFECAKVNIQTPCQRWDLPLPLIRCMIDNARSSIMSKLQQTCKYFYLKKSKIYCYRFFYYHAVHKFSKIKEQSLLLTQNSNSLALLKHFKAKKISITTSFIWLKSANSSDFNKLLSEYVYECDAKYIYIYNQIINENDFKFLCGRGNVESFAFVYSSIINNSDENFLKLETVLNLLPKIRDFYLKPGPNATNFLSTNNELSKLKLKNKLIGFNIHHVNNLIDPMDYCNFVKKNAAPRAEFNLRFHRTFDCSLVYPILKDAVKSMLDQWKPSKMTPEVNIYVL